MRDLHYFRIRYPLYTIRSFPDELGTRPISLNVSLHEMRYVRVSSVSIIPVFEVERGNNGGTSDVAIGGF